MLEKLFIVGNQAMSSVANLALVVLLGRWFGLEALGVVTFGLAVAYITSQILGALVLNPVASISSKFRPASFLRDVSTAFYTISTLALPVFVAATLGFAIPGTGAMPSLNLVLATAMTVSGVLLVEVTRRSLILISQNAFLWVVDLARFSLLFVGLYQLSTAPDVTADLLLAVVGGAFVAGCLPAWIWLRFKPEVWTVAGSAPRFISRRFLRLGRPLAGVEVLKFFNTDFPAFVLAGLIGPQAFGLFRISQSIAYVLRPLLVAMESLVPKWLGENYRSEGAARSRDRYDMVLVAGFAIALVINGLFFLAAPTLLRLAFPEVDANDVLPTIGILFVFVAFLTLNRMFAYGLRAESRMNLIFRVSATSATLSLLLSYPFVSLFEQIGVALVLLVAAVTESALYFRRRLKARQP